MLSSAKSSTNGHRAHDGWLEFVRAVYLCRHFGKALERHAQEETVDCINKILRICDGGDLFEGQKKTVTLLGFSPSTTTSSQTKSMHTFIHAGTELAYENGVSSTDDLDQVLGLVLQVSASFCAPRECLKFELNITFCTYFQNPYLQQEKICTAESCVTVVSDKLNELLYPVERRCASLIESVSQGATSRASISARLCEAILVESLSPENCFTLLKLALECGSDELKICCLQECLSSFQRALGDDLMGLTCLPYDTLKLLLSHDELQVCYNFNLKCECRILKHEIYCDADVDRGRCACSHCYLG